MSTNSDRWTNYLIFGGKKPEIEFEQVDLPDGLFICTVCNQVNDYWSITCQKHDDGKSDEGEDVR